MGLNAYSPCVLAEYSAKFPIEKKRNFVKYVFFLLIASIIL